MKKTTFLLLMLAFLLGTDVFAQTGTRAQYIQEYAQIAVDEMNRSGVPAAITLAQGILESGNGKVNWPENQTIILGSNVTVLGPANVSTTTMMRRGVFSQIRKCAPQL